MLDLDVGSLKRLSGDGLAPGGSRSDCDEFIQVIAQACRGVKSKRVVRSRDDRLCGALESAVVLFLFWIVATSNDACTN